MRQRWLMMVGLSLLAVGCSTAEPAPGPSRIDHIAYHADWQWGRASVVAEDAEGPEGWETQNDLGYRVRVTRGYLVSHSAQLTACPEGADADAVEDIEGSAGAGTSFSAEALPDLPSLISILDPRPRIALAGHGEDYGPTAVLTSHVESLLRPEPIDLGRLSVAAPVERRYCEAFYLIAIAGPAAVGLPSDVDMVGSSVYIEGFFAKAGEADTETASTDGTPFTLQTNLANGTIVDLEDPSALEEQAEAGSPSAATERRYDVRIHRDLGAIFDGIDFEAMEDGERAGALIRALIGATTIEVDEA